MVRDGTYAREGIPSSEKRKNDKFFFALSPKQCLCCCPDSALRHGEIPGGPVFLGPERSYAGSTSALRPSCRLFSSSFLPMKTRQVPVRPSGGLRQLISSPTTSR